MYIYIYRELPPPAARRARVLKLAALERQERKRLPVRQIRRGPAAAPHAETRAMRGTGTGRLAGPVAVKIKKEVFRLEIQKMP